MLLRVMVHVRERALRERLTQVLDRARVLFSFVPAQSVQSAVTTQPCDLILVEDGLPPKLDAAFVHSLRGLPDAPEVVVLCGAEDPERRASLVAAGCLAVVNAAVSDEGLERTLRALIKRRRDSFLARLRAATPADDLRLGDFVSASPAMRELLDLARRLVETDTSLVILGETGVGKEWLARAIHAQGPRAAGPFIAVNCGAIPESLLESELFGHEKGAFTGAIRSHRGHFELADRGTLFLDEIAETPTNIQVKLLRALQDHRIQRVGSESGIEVDVRVIAATNRDLDEEIRAARFRPDLYYRIGVVTLSVPPLRERREDIPRLAGEALKAHAARLGRRVARFEPDAERALMEYEWPGNVRELINVVERAVLLCTGGSIGLNDLPQSVIGTQPRPERASGVAETGTSNRVERWIEVPLREARQRVLESFERDYIAAQLRMSRGRVGDAARRAGISPRALFDKMTRHGLRKEDFKGKDGDYPETRSPRNE